MIIVRATELQNNFGKYLQKVIEGEEIVIMKNGKEVARMTPKDKVNMFLADSLVGMFKGGSDLTDEEIWGEKVKELYEDND